MLAAPSLPRPPRPPGAECPSALAGLRTHSARATAPRRAQGEGCGPCSGARHFPYGSIRQSPGQRLLWQRAYNPQPGVDGVQLCEPLCNHHNAVNTMPCASRPCLLQGAAGAMAILYTMCTREGDHWSKATVLVISCPEVRQRLIAYCARPNHDNHGNAPSQNGSAQPNGGPPYTAAVMDACMALAHLNRV